MCVYIFDCLCLVFVSGLFHDFGYCDLGICFFFFKQKTAYKMRISDWSSDVCSSDLQLQLRFRLNSRTERTGRAADLDSMKVRILLHVDQHLVGVNEVASSLDEGLEAVGQFLERRLARRIAQLRLGKGLDHVGRQHGEFLEGAVDQKLRPAKIRNDLAGLLRIERSEEH